MPDESTTSELVERLRAISALFAAGTQRDFDRIMAFYAPGAVWDVVALGTSFEGAAAIRAFLEDWRASYDEFEIALDEVQDLGNGVSFTVMAQTGRLAGGAGQVRYRFAQITTWVDGVAVRVTGSPDIDEARSAARRLADERANADG